MRPTDHTFTITISPSQYVRGKVVYLQPKEERAKIGTGPQSAIFHITTRDRLEPIPYEVRYSAPKQTTAGRFVPVTYGWDGDHWLFRGTFDMEE